MAKATLLRQYVQDFYTKTLKGNENYDAQYAEYVKPIDAYNSDVAIYNAQLAAYKKGQEDVGYKNMIRNANPDNIRNVLEQAGVNLTEAEAQKLLAQGGNVPVIFKNNPTFKIASPGQPPEFGEAPTREAPDWRTPLPQGDIKEVQNPHTDAAETELATAQSHGSNPTLTAQASESEPLQDLAKLRGGTGTQGILQQVLSGQLSQYGTEQPQAKTGTSTELRGIEL